jgi:PKD repeat protein
VLLEGTDFPASEVTTADFDAAVGAVDAQEKRSVALVHVVGGNQLETDVYKASVRLNAAFQFTVHAATGPFPVDFANTSTGDVQGVSWDFGDASTSVAVNPSHNYNSTGTYTVKLTVTDSNNKTNTYQTSVSINGAAGAGGATASYTYQMTTTPVYSAATQDHFSNPSIGVTETIRQNFDGASQPHIAIGDMDRDGFAEIMTTAQSNVSDTLSTNPYSPTYSATIWRSLWRIDPTTYAFAGVHAQQVTASGPIVTTLPYANAATVAGDFDGDSVSATLGSDCRAVSEPQLRNLIWMPPYFAALQSGALNNGNMSASFGINEKSGSSIENRSGSFTGNSISAYFGGSIGTPDGEPVHFRATLKAHAGHDWQSEHGAIHGEDTETDYSEGQAATVGDGLVVVEADSANCFSYDVVQSTGFVPNSAMRMCQITYQERTAETADTWNAQYDYAQTSPNWAPVQRDWASLALFRPATSTIPFTVGKQASNATDGLFSTPATSVTTTQPYLDIDLGSVQNISSIRVFPAANTDGSGNLVVPLGFEKASLDLIGFRVYVSATPFAGPDVPAGAGVSVFAPPTSGGVVYDRWNIMTLDSNFNPLPGRYIRLQHPGTDPARINVSQIEVFGDTHSDPPAFPDAVCEPTKAATGYPTNTNTGYFYARVWNPVAGGYQNIEERGDLMWSGTNATQQPTGVTLNGQACRNYQDVRETTIWNNLRIGNTGITNSWIRHPIPRTRSVRTAVSSLPRMSAPTSNWNWAALSNTLSQARLTNTRPE